MKNVILLMLLVSFSIAIEFDFTKRNLDKFNLHGLSSNIIYKNKSDRDKQIEKLWDKFLNSKFYDLKTSEDKKIYVVYSNYKSNSFDCFIGIKAKKKLSQSVQKMIPRSNYFTTILKYTKDMDMTTTWDEIQKQKLKRNYKFDIEQYSIMDLQKSKYFINIYLSRD